MALSRPFKTCYNTNAHKNGGEKHHTRVGRASSLHNAVLAATKRVMALDYAQADVYDALGRHRYRVRRTMHSSTRWDVVITATKVIALRPSKAA